METASLKPFATWARTALIREVTARIAVVLAPASPDRVEQPRVVAALEKAVDAAGGGEKGRSTLADRVAYTWFNRIIALRFMDANGYTGIGVVSPQAGVDVGQPEILAEAKRANIDSDVVSQKARETVTVLLNGTRRSDDPQGEAYALLLAEYCRHWNRSMPFMFEREGDFTELLIPANLLADDSVLSRAVSVLPADVCQDVEVIGWLYQFYISERKAEVFAGFKKNKKASAVEIPAATQLFTPHWIVRFLVENSLGRLWMLNRPSSRLIDSMDYYLPAVDAEADFLRIRTPEELKVIDPACGSGHLLTYAFDLLYEIYEEEGYAPSEIPELILANNLYGAEIDARAGALAAFALTMKARRRQRTFFKKSVQPNICKLEPISFLPAEMDLLVTLDGDRDAEEGFWNQFQQVDTFGSLIQSDESMIPRLRNHIEHSLPQNADLFMADVVDRARTVISNVEYLNRRYAVAVANPPYMGSRNMDVRMSEFLRAQFSESKQSVDASFISRIRALLMSNGIAGVITLQSWMFLSSFERFREQLLRDACLLCLAQFGPGAFDSIGGDVVSTAAVIIKNNPDNGRRGEFVSVTRFPTGSTKAEALRAAVQDGAGIYHVSPTSFKRVPGSRIAFWLSESTIAMYNEANRLGRLAAVKKGLDTGDNSRFLRFWHEVSIEGVSRGSRPCGERWVPYNKGGPFRRWYGNNDYVIDWAVDGKEIRLLASASIKRSTIRNPSYFYREGMTYGDATFSRFSARYTPAGSLWDNAGPMVFADRELTRIGAFLNSNVAESLLEVLSAGAHFQPGDVADLLFLPEILGVDLKFEECVEIARRDWDEFESSRDFQGSPLIDQRDTNLEGAVDCLYKNRARSTQKLAEFEASNNAVLAHLYNQDIRSDVSLSEVSLTGNPWFTARVTTEDAAYQAVRTDSILDLVSYAIGCMFGRYSIDEPGLIVASQGSTLRDYIARVPDPTFTPDADNVIPIVDGDWFEDDVVARFRQFLRASFGEQHFAENLRFVTEALGVKDLRDYFVKSFYKDHVQRFKKRPIYWLFSSPKGSFNALIYMHRYTPSTVSTVLNEYLREYKAKLGASLQHHERLVAGGGTPREQAVAQKEADRLRKVLLELDEYEHDVLYPLASQQIEIDLDDGVKVNYPKFGAALKKIPGLDVAE